MAVTTLEVTAREPYWGGQSFGDTGPYEKISGRLHFAVDPGHVANAPIADLSFAPRDADGMVTFSAGFRLLQPPIATGERMKAWDRRARVSRPDCPSRRSTT